MQRITQAIDSGDGVFIGGNKTTLHHNYKTMTNTELNLDQLRSVSGAGTETHWNQKLRNAKGNNNLKQLADSGELFQQIKYVPSEMFRFIPGDMY